MKKIFLLLSFVLSLAWHTTSFAEIHATVSDAKTSDGVVTITGKIDTALDPNFKQYVIKFESSSTATFTEDVTKSPEDKRPSQGIIADDGSFSITQTNLIPHTGYWYRIIITDPDKNNKVFLGKFDSSSDGLIISGSTQEQDDFESRSYRLLAPLPGLSVLLDPDLCREQKIEHPEKGQICSINDFLNYIFRLLIGVAAVILVIRIMIEGFKYATSDVISIKVSSKEKLWQGIWGLLLALSAWLILNTINPKLVENDLNLPTVNLTIEDKLAVTYAGYDLAGKLPNPDDIKKLKIQWEQNYQSVRTVYTPALEKALPNIPKGMKILMIAQTSHEGFFPGTKSYRTNNPGNIGNTDDGSIKSFPTLEEGIKAQYSYIVRAVSGQNKNFAIGAKNPAALGSETYQGYLYQYLRIYATGARANNAYLSFIITYFEKEGMTITPRSLMTDITAMK
jgi:hypothetical protein